MSHLLVITGVGPHSLGEMVGELYLRKTQGSLIGIDRTHSALTDNHTNARKIIFDLNPLAHSGGISEFARDLESSLLSAVTSLKSHSITSLLQCAGVYEYGAFLDSDARRRSDVLGLNIFGSTEMLHAAMAVNSALAQNANQRFSHILLGSFQGLYSRADRSLYASSKAYSLDLCSALTQGLEIHRNIYVAAGPIDTPMLHRNHWVAKAKGPKAFFDRILAGKPCTYRAIFVDCDQHVFGSCLERESVAIQVQLQMTFDKYRMIRRETTRGALGILSRLDCSAVLHQLLCREDLKSGVYMLSAPGSVVSIRMAKFEDLDRRRTFESVAIPVVLNR